MRPQGHIAAGLLLWSGLSDDVKEIPWAVLMANVPDFDREIMVLLGHSRSSGDHHRWPTHSPALAGILAGAMLAIGKRTGNQRLAGMGCLALASHLALDTVSDGIAWAYPFSKRKFGLYLDPGDKSLRAWLTRLWPKSPTGTLERLMFLGALGMRMRRVI